MKSWNWTRALPLVALLVAAVAAFGPGCGGDDPSNGSGGSPGAGGTQGTGGSGGDGGQEPVRCTANSDCPALEECSSEGFCIPKTTCEDDVECAGDSICVDGYCEPPCRIDAECGFNTGTYCDDAPGSATFGRCVQGEGCQLRTAGASCGQSETDEFTYCDGDVECVCVPDDSFEDSRIDGVCRRRTPTCAPCQEDIECGDTAAFNPRAQCKSFNFDGEDMNVCLPVRAGGSCPAGTVPADPTDFENLENHCVPPSLDCADFAPCGSDDDCKGNPAAPICDTSRRICVPGCMFNFEAGKSELCPSGQVCHAMPFGTDPALVAECATAPLFGQGKCGPQCQQDSDCAVYDGGTGDYICVTEFMGENRCRPRSEANPTQPACLSDNDCPESGDPIYLGYCDLKADPTRNECVFDTCRPGVDPTAGCGSERPYLDCTTSWKCQEFEDRPGYGECVPMDCIDKGGASVGCMTGEFCAGEQMRDLLTGEVTGNPLPWPQGVGSGDCYGMDENTWCATPCSSAADCTNGPTDYADSPAICNRDLPDGPGCAWGCQYNQECPGGWRCNSTAFRVQCGYGVEVLKTCESDAECGPGNSCVEPVLRGREYSFGTDELAMLPFKVCECSGTNECGTGFSCNAGLGTTVLQATSDNYGKRVHQYCVDDQAMDTCGGAGGSCEWFGDTAQPDPESRHRPLFLCGNTPENFPFPGNGQPNETVACPATAGDPPMNVRAGKTAQDQFNCVTTSVCMPGLYMDAEGEMVCGIQPRD